LVKAGYRELEAEGERGGGRAALGESLERIQRTAAAIPRSLEGA
jgi:hypothetical protein